nr:OmpH family outer membrane protein [Thiomicrorhabdus aquaedulcis]
MQKIIKLYSAVFLMTLSTLSLAEEPVKVGVVNVALLLEQAPQAKLASAKLEREFAPQQTELKGLAANLDKQQNDYQKIKRL